MDFKGHILTNSSEETDHFTQDLTVADQDRVHMVVLRLETNKILFFKETFDGDAVHEQGNDDIRITGTVLSTDQDQITIQNACIDHALTLHMQHEYVAVVRI